jgi:hypothetical protein
LTADKCTHFSKWNHDAVRAAYCKEYTSEQTCNNVDELGNMKGRNYIFKTGYDCEGGTEIFSTSVTTTAD